MSSAPKKDRKTYHPISLYQDAMINQAVCYPADAIVNRQKIIRWAFRVRPSVSVRTLQRAFDTLVARHDSLRLYFELVGGDWKAVIRPKHPYGLIVEDLSALTVTEQERMIQERADQPLSALAPAMFEMYLMKCGKEGDVVIMRVQHAIGDGYSAAILIEDLMKAVLRMPLGPQPPGHAAFIRFREKALAHRAEEKEAYWHDKLLPLPNDLNIGRTAKGLLPQTIHTVGETRRLDRFIPAEDLDRLERLTRSTGVSAYCYLMAAFGETICALAGETEVFISSMFGRADEALANFVGAETQQLETRYQVDPSDLSGRAAWYADQLAEAVKNLPCKFFENPRHKISDVFRAANRSTRRFGGNVVTPSGRFSNSPFKGIFGKAMKGKAVFGPVSFEQISLPKRSDTSYELIVVLNKFDTGLEVSLVADVKGYTGAEQTEIAEGIRDRIKSCLDQHAI